MRKKINWFKVGMKLKSRAGVSALILALAVSMLPVQTMRVFAEEEAEQDMSMSGDGESMEPQSDGQQDSARELDYILGRPMTPEEEQAQREIAEVYLGKTGWVEPQDFGIDISLSESDPIVWGTYPSSYDSRNVDGKSYIPTQVRSQNPYGTCWAFASLACMESNLIKKGLADTSVDLSEAHLVYYSNFSAKDPLGNDGSDYVVYNDESEPYWDAGGNTQMSGHAMMNWKGAVAEETVPYSDIQRDLGQDNTDLAYGADVAYMVGWYQIEMSDVSAVKAAIMKYGAVAASYNHWDGYYNVSTAAYYCSENISTNHAVTIVGWDDNYNKANFSTQPAANGAWLVRSSWGNYWGNGGYFWISYEDKSLYSKVTVFEATTSDEYDNNYQYDHASAISYTSASKAASIFEVKANNGKEEELKAVSIYLMDSCVNYSVQIYRNLKDLSDPTSGEECLTVPVSGRTTYAGYYTIPLGEAVRLGSGDIFSVVFTIAKEGESGANIAMERTSTVTHPVSTASAEVGQSLFYHGSTWWDAGTLWGTNLKIKAFTNNLVSSSVSVTGISISKKSARIKVGETVALSASVQPSNASNKGIAWVSSDTSVATVDENGVVTGVKGGTAVITARSMNGGYEASCTVTVSSVVKSISFTYGWDSVCVGSKFTAAVNILPEDATDKTLRWTSSAPEIIRVDEKTGEILVLDIGSAEITATANNGVSKTVQLTSFLPSGGYIGHINSELYTFDLKQTDEGGYYLTGEIIVVEWVNGVSTVPTAAPIMTFQSTDGKESIEVFVTPTGTNTYYFDRFIEGLSADKEYVFEIASGDRNNYSPYRSMNVLLTTSPKVLKVRNLGKIGEQKICYHEADNGELRLYRRTKSYVGNINSELKKTELVTGPNGNYVSGEIVVVEWEDGVSTVPFDTPVMTFRSTDGKEILPVWVTPTGTNTYYFDRSLGDLDTRKEYIFTIESGDSLNVSPSRAMIVTTAAMKNKEGTLWESSTQYVRYKTNPQNGQLIIYGENK